MLRIAPGGVGPEPSNNFAGVLLPAAVPELLPVSVEKCSTLMRLESSTTMFRHFGTPNYYNRFRRVSELSALRHEGPLAENVRFHRESVACPETKSSITRAYS